VVCPATRLIHTRAFYASGTDVVEQATDENARREKERRPVIVTPALFAAFARSSPCPRVDAYGSSVGEENRDGRAVTTQGDRGGDRDGRADRDRGRYFPLRAQGEQRRHSGKLNMSAKRKATAIMQHHKVSTAMHVRTRARTLACSMRAPAT